MHQKIKFFCIALMLTGALAACSSQSAKPMDFDQFADQLWQAEKDLNNRSKTSLPDLSAATLAAQATQRQQWLDKLQQVDVAVMDVRRLSGVSSTILDVTKGEIEVVREGRF